MDLSIPEIIIKKRDGQQLTAEEIQFFIQSVVTKQIDDAQTGAMLMALYLNKMTMTETVNLVKSMISTAETLRFENISKDVLVDKHSTGGVGDKTSLVLAPALAACGLKVPMISGRSLGFTGGTLDKLESIPGFQVFLNFNQMSECLEKSGFFICGANDSLVPADGILYKIRDITSTVEDRSLIAASILSKKAAEGIVTLLMDVKFGRGSAFKTESEAMKMAEFLQEIGRNLDLNIRIILSEMNVPLGTSVGNSLEVVESVMCLRNEISNSVSELVKVLGGVILHDRGRAKTVEEGKKMIQKTLENSTALSHFQRMLLAQGVSENDAEDLCSGKYWKVLSKAPYQTLLRSPKIGVVAAIDALHIAQACRHLGGGRMKADSKIDHSVGVVILKSVGEDVAEGEPWIEVHSATETLPPDVEILIQDSLTVEKSHRKAKETLKTILF